MDASSTLETVDTEADLVAVARRHLGSDGRVTFHVVDGAEFLRQSPKPFDLIYADAWPGKFSHLDEALSLLRAGGIYVIDDLLPQPNWPEGHAPKDPGANREPRATPGLHRRQTGLGIWSDARCATLIRHLSHRPRSPLAPTRSAACTKRNHCAIRVNETSTTANPYSISQCSTTSVESLSDSMSSFRWCSSIEIRGSCTDLTRTNRTDYEATSHLSHRPRSLLAPTLILHRPATRRTPALS